MAATFRRRVAPGHPDIAFRYRLVKRAGRLEAQLTADTQLLPASALREQLPSVLGAVEVDLICLGLDPGAVAYAVLELRVTGWVRCPLQWRRGFAGVPCVTGWGSEEVLETQRLPAPDRARYRLGYDSTKGLGLLGGPSAA